MNTSELTPKQKKEYEAESEALEALRPSAAIRTATAQEEAISRQPDPCGLEAVVCEGEKEAKKVIRATVTTYQAVPEQTDGDPCHTASGLYVCPAPYPVVANDQLPFGTKVEIRGTVYTVEDRFGGNYPVTKFDVLTDGENYRLINESVIVL